MNRVCTFLANKGIAPHFCEISLNNEICNVDTDTLSTFDLTIMDISAAEKSGINCAQKLRAMSIAMPIILIAQTVEYALESYDVTALFYLMKPLAEDKFELAMERFWLNYRPKSIFIRNRLYVTDDIVYCESRLKSVFIYFNNNNFVEIREKLDNIKTKLTGNNFIRCHQSYIVNMDYVNKIDNCAFIVKSNEPVPFRKRELQKYRKIYLDYVTKTQLNKPKK